jgi:integral membrane protein
VKKLFNVYRVLAYLVGTLLLLGTLDLVAKYLFTDGSAIQRAGDRFDLIWIGHGWVYMVYVVVAFMLSRHAGWTLRFLGVLLIAGLVPGLIFWIERLVDERVRPWIAEEANATA